MDNITKEMNLLLNNFWITKDENPESYYAIKRKQKELTEFIYKNLGSKLIIHDRFIKLEKLSTIPSKDQGIEQFTSQMDYVFLFIILLYLEDKPKGEKFILSQLIEYIKNTSLTLELTNIPNWTITSHRKSLVRVIKYLLELHVITLKDEEKISFQDDEHADALYEVTGISNYLIPSFDYEIYGKVTPKDFLDQEWGEQDTTKGDVRRFKVYRNLLYLPAVHKEDLTESEYDYLKKMHKTIEKELEENLDFSAEITQNMALVYTNEQIQEKNYFPNTKRLSDITLLVNNAIKDYIEKENINKNQDESYTLTKEELNNLIIQTRETKKTFFSKAYLELTPKKYLNEIISNLQNYHFIKEKENTYKIYPLIYRFLGEAEPIKENKNSQIELFGGEIDEL